MKESYEQAIDELEDRIIKAIARAEDNGLTNADIVAELRRIADQTEKEDPCTKLIVETLAKKPSSTSR